MAENLYNLPFTRAEAIRLGSKRYFTGKPCSYGHIAARYASCQRCVQCNSILNKTPRRRYCWRINNPEKAREWQMRYDARIAHKRATDPQFDAAYRAKKRAQRRRMELNHPEKIKEYARRRSIKQAAIMRAFKLLMKEEKLCSQPQPHEPAPQQTGGETKPTRWNCSLV